MTKVLTFKLVSGEEVIGREVESIITSEKFVRLERVRTIGVQPAGGGQMGIGLMPFAFSQHDGVIVLSRSSIVAEFVPDAKLERIYLDQTSPIKLI